MKLVKLLLSVAILITPCQGIRADEKATDTTRQPFARRHACADAVCKIVKTIASLKLSPQASVGDFLDSDRNIVSAVTFRLMTAGKLTKSKDLPRGGCKLTVRIKIDDIKKILKEVHGEYYQGEKFKTEDFEHIFDDYKGQFIVESGIGLASPEPPEAKPAVSHAGDGPIDFSSADAGTREFWTKHCTKPGRLTAEKNAQIDARRRLEGRVADAFITPDTTIGSFVEDFSKANVNMSTFMVGARRIGARYHGDKLIVEVVMEISLRKVYMALNSWAKRHYKTRDPMIDRFEEMIVKTDEVIVREIGMGVPPADCLVDATEEMKRVITLAAEAPDRVTMTIKAEGKSELAARVKLAEKIYALPITPKPDENVKNLAAKNDSFQAAIFAFLMGAEVVRGSQRLEMELELKGLWNMILTECAK